VSLKPNKKLLKTIKEKMCSYDSDEYEYHIHGDIDLSILKTPKNIEELSRQERFKIYGELYHLFLHVSQEIHKYICYKDMDDKRVEVFMEQIPSIDSSHRDLETQLKNYTDTEDDRLKENLTNIKSEISWTTSHIEGVRRDVKMYKESLERSELNIKMDQEKLETLRKKCQEIEDKIKEKREKVLE